MKTKQVSLLLLAFLGLGVSVSQAELQSLRGAPALDETSPAHELKPRAPDTGVKERAFVQQPPLIPHKVEGYQVDLRFNKCLSCHSWKNYKKAKATKISLTHFKDRDGKELSDVSPTRYFCNQCHVPQVDAKPLVENQFQPVDAMSH